VWIMEIGSGPYNSWGCRTFTCTLPGLRWLGGRKGIRPVKKWGNDGGRHWLVRMEWRPAGLSVSLPLLIFPCTIKSISSGDVVVPGL